MMPTFLAVKRGGLPAPSEREVELNGGETLFRFGGGQGVASRQQGLLTLQEIAKVGEAASILRPRIGRRGLRRVNRHTKARLSLPRRPQGLDGVLDLLQPAEDGFSVVGLGQFRTGPGRTQLGAQAPGVEDGVGQVGEQGAGPEVTQSPNARRLLGEIAAQR
jgi:hypothetical protein